MEGHPERSKMGDGPRRAGPGREGSEGLPGGGLGPAPAVLEGPEGHTRTAPAFPARFSPHSPLSTAP